MPSAIEWTDETWNPVTGCSRVSPGCDNCYMFALYPRLKGMGVLGYQESPETVQIWPARLLEPYKWRKPRVVFVNSMSDLFHRDVPFDFINSVFDVMSETSIERGHTFQILTKRPGRAVAWWKANAGRFGKQWPENVWIGTSIESAKYVPRIKVLKRIPAKVRFVSAEPLLGRMDISSHISDGQISWVIAGGESGSRARPMKIEWATNLRDQCIAANTPFFFKQWGTYDQYGVRLGKRRAGRSLEGREWNELPNGAQLVPVS